MSNRLCRIWIGVATVFVWFIPHLRMYTEEATRYYTFWDRTDTLALGIVLVGGGCGLAAFYTLAQLTRVRLLRRAADAGFVLALGLGAVIALRTSRFGGRLDWWMPLTTGFAVAVVGCALACLHPRAAPAPRLVRGICLVLSPAVPLVLVQMALYPEFSVRTEQLRAPQVRPAALVGPPAGSIYLFIFDEWSYARTFTNELPEEMPHLARLVERSTVFHDAHAPFGATRLSLPGILFQTGAEFSWSGGQLGFRGVGGFTPVTRQPNLFTRMQARGYATHLAGFSHPYRRMFGAELDDCFATPDGRGNADAALNADDLLRHLRLGAALAAMALPKPAGLDWRVQAWCTRDDLGALVGRVGAVHERALKIVRSAGPGFAVLHYPLPHDPFLFDRDGVNLDLTRTMPLDFGPYGRNGFVRPNPRNHVARYRGNLRYLDTVLGELLAAMESAGDADDATLILTSDHTWRFDPELDDLYIERGLPFRSLNFDPVPRELTHVPLVISRPGQCERIDVGEPVELIHLLDMLDAPGRFGGAEMARAAE